jgi:hypothetical protein
MLLQLSLQSDIEGSHPYAEISSLQAVNEPFAYRWVKGKFQAYGRFALCSSEFKA